jgi:hypothetical protein
MNFKDDQKYLSFCYDIMYYFIKVWKIIIHDYVILKAFQIL